MSSVTDTLWSLFAQDNFRIFPDLTLNLGLRYEQQTFTDARKDFAPRVGFAYSAGGRGRTAVRGGFGIYYSQVVNNAQANYALSGPTGFFNFTAGPGQVGFPSSVSAAPLPSFPAGSKPAATRETNGVALNANDGPILAGRPTSSVDEGPTNSIG